MLVMMTLARRHGRRTYQKEDIRKSQEVATTIAPDWGLNILPLLLTTRKLYYWYAKSVFRHQGHISHMPVLQSAPNEVI